MRTAAICPTCATYENALCIVYNGPYLTNIKVNPLEDLQSILAKINTNLVPLSGIIAPSTSATYLGQTYLNTAKSMLYFAKAVGTGASDWSIVLTTPIVTPQYADNSAALFAGLVAGQIYRTGDLLKIVH
tara:strand:+ start:14799 stop:15188 length:390 start_codon:yes stop_codon:yes gene_type:complete